MSSSEQRTQLVDAHLYAEATQWTHQYLREARWVYEPSALPNISRCVYVVLGRDGRVAYVGSTSRSLGGLRERWCEHESRGMLLDTWKRVWVIEVSDECSDESLRWVEGMVGLVLSPSDNRRLPSIIRR